MVLSRVDRVILSRIGLRVGVTVLVFFGLIVLAESLNTQRFATMQAVGGIPLAVLAMVVPAACSLARCFGITPLATSARAPWGERSFHPPPGTRICRHRIAR